MFVENENKVHIQYCFSGGGQSFHAGERQMEETDSPEVNSVKLRLKNSKGDQGRNGGILVRTKGDGDKGRPSSGVVAEIV